MPKIYDTKKQRARELYRLLEIGPANLDESAKRKYKLWVDSWILSEVFDLIPELKKHGVK